MVKLDCGIRTSMARVFSGDTVGKTRVSPGAARHRLALRACALSAKAFAAQPKGQCTAA